VSRLLVCPPDYFAIEYEINPWMRRSNIVDHERAVTQWHRLMEVLERDMGAVLERMRPVPGLPDLVFTANAGVAVGRQAVVSRFRYAERQREEAHFEQWFRAAGFEVVTFDQEFFFEGAGDLLGFPEYWFGGYRQRSDIRMFPLLSERFARDHPAGVSGRAFLSPRYLCVPLVGRGPAVLSPGVRLLWTARDQGAGG